MSKLEKPMKLDELDVYEPEEDSFLLLEALRKEFAKENFFGKNILEVGVGSGVILNNLFKEFPKNNYFGTDINPNAVMVTTKSFEKDCEKQDCPEVLVGSLFGPFSKRDLKFDIVYFNTPYLPCEDKMNFDELGMKDKAIYGGKKGCEVIFKFIEGLGNFLSVNGVCYLLYSSLSKPKNIEELLVKENYEFKVLITKSLFFEDLIVLKVWKSDLRKKVENFGVSELRYLASGKHSENFEGVFEGKTCVIKIGLDEHISQERFFLEKLKDEKFVPKLYGFGEGFVVREKFDGVQIKDFVENCSKEELVEVFEKACEICLRLDELGINKDEMTNPYKHIFIEKAKTGGLVLKMIDFERCLFSEKAHNLTQFLEYVKRTFKLRGFGLNLTKLESFAKEYVKLESKKRKGFVLRDFLH